MTNVVTVGIPFFNNAETILMAVRSVFAQSHQDWRLLLVDDGSTDRSVEIVRQIDDPRVEVLSDGLNLGLASRLNQLSSLVESPFMARMDADDVMHPMRLEAQLAVLGAGADLVCSGAISIDASGRPTGYRRAVSAMTPGEHFRRSPYIHPTVIGLTQWFREHPYDPSYRRCQDQELWVRTLGDRTVAVVEEPLLYLREAGTVPAAKYARSMAGTRQLVREHARGRLGVIGAARATASTYAKQVTYTAAEWLHLSERLVRSRSAPLAPSEEEKHIEILEEVDATSVPGVDA